MDSKDPYCCVVDINGCMDCEDIGHEGCILYGGFD